MCHKRGVDKEERVLTKTVLLGWQKLAVKVISNSVTLFLFYMGLTVAVLILILHLLNPQQGGGCTTLKLVPPPQLSELTMDTSEKL